MLRARNMFLSDSRHVVLVMSTDFTIRNGAFDQPFSPFFIMVHNETTQPLFEVGEPASNELALLAEAGSKYSSLACCYDIIVLDIILT